MQISCFFLLTWKWTKKGERERGDKKKGHKRRGRRDGVEKGENKQG
jgi:hypothetical protein